MSPSQRMRCATVAALCLFFVLSSALSASAVTCRWMSNAADGQTTQVNLQSPSPWAASACPSGVVHYTVTSTSGCSANFPSSYSPVLEVTPTSTQSKSVSYAYVGVSAMCDGITPLCSGSPMVYIAVRPTTTVAPTEKPVESTTAVPTSSPTSTSTQTPTQTASPAPETPPVCGRTSEVDASVGVATTIDPLAGVQNCTRPATVYIDSQPSSNLFTVSTDAMTGQPVVVFDAKGSNTAEGVFTADVRVVCSNGNTAVTNECTLSQTVVVSRQVTSAPSTEAPACSGSYGYRTSFDTVMQQTISLSESDMALCPVSSGRARHFVFTATSSPRYNPDSFVFGSDGEFTYVAPSGPPAKVDSFTFTVACAYGDSATAGEETYSLCGSTVTIRVTASPTTQAPTQTCSGNFTYSYALNADGSFTTTTSSLAARATVVRNTNCPSNNYTAAKITSAPSHGTLDSFNAGTGSFAYSPASSLLSPQADMDSFNFQLTCADDSTYVCAGTATISVTAAESNDTIYHLHDDLITCKGTCNAYTGVRADGREVGSLSVDFTSSGTLLIHAYTTISNLQAQFVSFTPLSDVEGLLNSAATPRGTHVSFEPTCLNSQATYGTASNVVTWTNTDESVLQASQMKGALLNTLTDNYHLGDNYYQKFGGKHRYCDIFRENPCKYAPMLTPTLDDDNNNADDNTTLPVSWRLYINGCDATWVGEASVESLRALRQPDGTATFQLTSDTELDGALYLQTVTPASLTDPSKGVTVNTTEYVLHVTIRNTVVVDAVAVAVATASDESMSLASDVQYAIGRTRSTNERIYAYSILLYPSRTVNNVLVSVNTSIVRIDTVSLINWTFTSPSRTECPECTGTKMHCQGVNKGFQTDCGDLGIVVFEPLDEKNIEYNQTAESVGGANLFPSTSLAGQKNLYNLSFAIRASGANSANSADAYPVGQFFLSVAFSDGQTFVLRVDQADYVSGINSSYIVPRTCRSSAYWPVANPLGDSLPITPFDAQSLAGVKVTDSGEVLESTEEEKNEYTAPTHLSSQCVSSLPASRDLAGDMNVSALTSVVDGVTVSMCVVEEERTYGVTDWFTISVPSITETRASINKALSRVVINDPTLENDLYTTAELQYLVLSVSAGEAISPTTLPLADDSGFLNILLDGANPPSVEVSEEDRWMLSASEGERIQYYNWAEDASFLNYRRYRYEANESSADSLDEPFNFAFIPGSLLHSTSSARVAMRVSMSIKFTTYGKTKDTAASASQVVTVKEKEEKLFYVISVSRAISAAMRFDSDAYSPTIVTVKVSGLGRKSATALLVILLILVIAVLAASIYIEFTYKRIIHNAKYHPKRPDSAVGVRYGRDGKPLAGQEEAIAASHHLASATTTPRAATTPKAGAQLSGKRAAGGKREEASAVKTTFGTIGTEQVRVQDTGDDSSSSQAQKGGKDSKTKSAAGGVHEEERPPMGEEQERTQDDEVANF